MASNVGNVECRNHPPSAFEPRCQQTLTKTHYEAAIDQPDLITASLAAETGPTRKPWVVLDRRSLLQLRQKIFIVGVREADLRRHFPRKS
jgi:hypothetical protein